MSLRAITPRPGGRAKDFDRLLSGTPPRDQRGEFLGALVQDLREASASGAPETVAARHLEKMRSVASSAAAVGPQPILEGAFGDEDFLPPLRRGAARLVGIAAAACVLLLGGLAMVGLPQGRGVRSAPVVPGAISLRLPAADGTSVGQFLFSPAGPRSVAGCAVGQAPWELPISLSGEVAPVVSARPASCLSPREGVPRRSSGNPNRSGGVASGDATVGAASPITVVTASLPAHGSEHHSSGGESSNSGGSDGGTEGGGTGRSGGGTSTGQNPTTGTGGATDHGKGHGGGGKGGGGGHDVQTKSVEGKHGGSD